MSLAADLRYALRTLRRSPGFALTAVACLALGIGANTAIFSMVNAILLRPFPFAGGERLVSLYATAQDGAVYGLSMDDLAELRADGRSFGAVAGMSGRSFTLTDGDQAERVQGAAVTPELFPMLGVRPQLGRLFRADEAQPAGFEPTVLLSDGLWRHRYAADPSIVGRTIRLNDRALVVAGVMPPGFRFPETEQLWVPLGAAPGEERDQRYVVGLARVKPGVSVEQAAREAAAIAARRGSRYPDTHAGWGLRVLGFREDHVDGDARTLFYVMMGAVLFVLLIACANVANLMLARGADRAREMALRTALGAARGVLVRQLLAESALIALAGGAAGVLLATWWTRAVLAAIPEELPYWIRIEVDGSVLAYTLLVSLATALVFGLIPALRASRPDLQGALQQGGRAGSGPRGNRLRGALIAGELSLSVILLAGAGLMIRSFLEVQRADAGFPTERVLSLRVHLPGDRYDDPATRVAFAQQLEERLAALPGVAGAGVTTSLPTDDGGRPVSVSAEGAAVPDSGVHATGVASTSGLFGALGVPLVAGRALTAQEAADTAQSSVIVGSALAARLWPGRSAVGRRIRVGQGQDVRWSTVVGVARPLQYEEFGEETPRSLLQLHLPYAATPGRQGVVLVRTSGDPAALSAAVRRVIREIDPHAAPFDLMTMRQVRDLTTWPTRVFGGVFGMFAIIALVLAATGIYGVTSYSVAQRSREMGVRMALGARGGDVLALVVGGVARLAAAGVVVGLLGALGLTRLMSSMLYGVSATDAATLLGAPLVLAAIALLAAYLPARRATRVDPIVALRSE